MLMPFLLVSIAPKKYQRKARGQVSHSNISHVTVSRGIQKHEGVSRGKCLNVRPDPGFALLKGRLKIPLTLIADPVTIAVMATGDVAQIEMPVSPLQSP